MYLFRSQRQVRTAYYPVIVTAKKTPSRNRFLPQRFACLTSHGGEANRRREKQVKRSSQSEASAKYSASEAANQKRPPRTAQAYGPIKSRRLGQLKRTDRLRRVHEAEKARRSSNQIRLAGSKADASSHQTEASARSIGAIGRTIFGRTFFGRTFFGRTIQRKSNRWIRLAYPTIPN